MDERSVKALPFPRVVASRERWSLLRSGSLVGLAGAAALLALGSFVRHASVPRGDDLIYERMAVHPFAVHTFPFGYRLGLPVLINSLPLTTNDGFLALAYRAAGAAAFFSYLLMQELEAEPRVAAALGILMCVSPPFLIVVIRGGRNTDIATIAFMMAATYFAVRKAYWPLAITLLLGTTVREAVLFVIPLAYALWADSLVDTSAAIRVLAVGAPATLGYLAIRLGITTVGEAQVPGYGGSLLGERLGVVSDGLRTPFQELRRIASIYGPLWLTLPAALSGMRFARRGLTLIVLCLLSMTFALDWGRMILLAAPVVYPAGAWTLTRYPKWQLVALIAMLALTLVYAGYMQISGAQTGIIETGPPPYPVR